MLAGKWPNLRGGRYGNKEKPERNAAVQSERASGKSYVKLGEMFNICAMRAWQICNREKYHLLRYGRDT